MNPSATPDITPPNAASGLGPTSRTLEPAGEQDVADLADGQAAVVSDLTDALPADVLLRDPFVGDGETFG